MERLEPDVELVYPDGTGSHFGLWFEHRIVVFDVETTGLSPENDRIVEVGLARFENGEVTRTWGSLVNPGMPIPAVSTNVHGIRDEDVASAPSLTLVAPQIASMSAGAWPCAYNASFDKSFLLASIQRSGLDMEACAPIFVPGVPWLDPLVWLRDKRGIKGGNRLENICREFGIDTGQSHRAESDAVAAGNVLLEAASVPRSTMCAIMRKQEWMRRQQQEVIDGWSR